MTTRTLLTLLSALALLGLTACDSSPPPEVDGSVPPDGDSSVPAEDGDAGDGGVVVPAMPTLGAQLDRAGRAGIAALLVAPYDDAGRGAQRDAYNTDADPGGWAASYTAAFEPGLAVLDGVDTVCGNQLLAAPSGDRYQPLASLLADDRLYVDSSSSTCSVYLGVELAASGVPNDDCGGRVPSMDVVEHMYSMLIAGMLEGIDDTVAAPGNTTMTFPFLAAPH